MAVSRSWWCGRSALCTIQISTGSDRMMTITPGICADVGVREGFPVYGSHPKTRAENEMKRAVGSWRKSWEICKEIVPKQKV